VLRPRYGPRQGPLARARFLYKRAFGSLLLSLSSLTLDPRIRTTNTIGFALHLGASLSTVLTEFATGSRNTNKTQKDTQSKECSVEACKSSLYQ
jgi:hypothetical protein